MKLMKKGRGIYNKQACPIFGGLTVDIYSFLEFYNINL